MPHHSTKSWATHLSGSRWREKLAKWRKRAEILHRKDAEQRSASREDRQSTSPRAGPSKSPAALQKVDPFQIITSFFVQGNADNLTDDEVWKMMERQVHLLMFSVTYCAENALPVPAVDSTAMGGVLGQQQRRHHCGGAAVEWHSR